MVAVNHSHYQDVSREIGDDVAIMDERIGKADLVRICLYRSSMTWLCGGADDGEFVAGDESGTGTAKSDGLFELQWGGLMTAILSDEICNWSDDVFRIWAMRKSSLNLMGEFEKPDIFSKRGAVRCAGPAKIYAKWENCFIR